MSSNTSPIIKNRIIAADSPVSLSKQRVLMIGIGTGDNPSKQLIKDVQSSDRDTLLGDLSIVAYMLSRFRQIDQSTVVDILTLEEPKIGTNAKGGLKITGVSAVNTTFVIYVGDNEFRANVDILKNDSASVVATKIVEAMKDKGFLLKGTVNNDDNELIDTSFIYKGTVGNNLYLEVSGKTPGLKFDMVGTSGGSGTYDTENLFDGLTEQYKTVLFDSCVDFDYVAKFLEDRAKETNTSLQGSGFCMMNGTLTDMKSFVIQKNYKTMTVFANPDEQRITCIPSLFIADFASKRTLRLTEGADLQGIVVNPEEYIGGVEKASLPYHKTPMDYVPAKSQISAGTLQSGQNIGLSFIVNSDSGFGVELSEVLTLYKEKPGGGGDATFSRLNSVDCSFIVDEYEFRNLKSKYGQTRASFAASIFRTNKKISVATVEGIKTTMRKLYGDLARMGILKGEASAVKYFDKNLEVALDATSGDFTVSSKYVIMGQLIGIDNTIKISLAG